MKKTYHGSCHCGRVRFEVDADLEAGTGRCNCSYCQKVREWSVIVKPEDFRLLCIEANETSDYQFNTMSGHHRFCRTCGLHAYGTGHVEEIGGAFVAVSISCLDNLDDSARAALPIRFMDGRDDNWFSQPAVIGHL